MYTCTHIDLIAAPTIPWTSEVALHWMLSSRRAEQAVIAGVEVDADLGASKNQGP